MVSIQNYSANSQNVAFRAKMNEKANSSNPTQSHAGLKTGAVWSAIATPVALGTLGLTSWANSTTQDAAKNAHQYFNAQEAQQFLKIARDSNLSSKAAWATLPINIAIALGCGALVDKLNNTNRAKFAEELAAKGEKAILEENDNAGKTRSGNVYCKSGEGKKWGALLGMVGLVVPNLLSTAFTSAKGVKVSKAFQVATLAQDAIFGALGGLALGAIADSYSNKTAAKNANKLASQSQEPKEAPAEAKESEDTKESEKA